LIWEKFKLKGNCWNCGTEMERVEFGRQDVCPKCLRDVRCCRNCIQYDRAYNNECKESQADRVVEKEKSNFCDYFSPRSQAGAGGASRDALKAAADALFKKGGK